MAHCPTQAYRLGQDLQSKEAEQEDTGFAVGFPGLGRQGTEPQQPQPRWSGRRPQSLGGLLGTHQGIPFPSPVRQMGMGVSCPPHFMGRTQSLCMVDPKNK